ncbi:MAG: hypothetical protein HOL58_01820 [Francisellaceae bacterium]|nr:hypothetical protein [Francisellaceae bacterium]
MLRLRVITGLVDLISFNIHYIKVDSLYRLTVYVLDLLHLFVYIDIDEWRKNRTKQGRLPDKLSLRSSNHSLRDLFAIVFYCRRTY